MVVFCFRWGTVWKRKLEPPEGKEERNGNGGKERFSGEKMLNFLAAAF